jgi:tRNA-specific 2-thiouridylase
VIYLNECNWLMTQWPQEMQVEVKFRSVMKTVPARLIQEQDEVFLICDTPHYGISPGQAAVIYSGERVLGGGWITRTELRTDHVFEDTHQDAFLT